MKRSPDIAIIMEWSPFYARMQSHEELCREMMGKLFAEGFFFFRIIADKWNADNSAPKLAAIPSLDALLTTPHCDLVVCRDLTKAAAPFRFEIED